MRRWWSARSAIAPRCCALLREHGVDTVMHFAAYTIVPESVREPLKYYGNNTCSTRTLLECCVEAEVRHFVFSSTAAVYGIPAGGVAAEDYPDRAHQSLRHLQAHVGVDAARARAGDAADATRRCAISTSPAPIPPAASARRRRTRRCSSRWPARRPSASARKSAIFGTDYPTPDGTGVRDYIHVEDLAARPPRCARPTCAAAATPPRSTSATGTATACARCSRASSACRERSSRVREEPRRAGDPPALVARAERIRTLLGWQPRLDDLDTIVRSAYAWEQQLLREPW